MRKLLLLLLLLALPALGDKLKIVTTTTDLADATRSIGGDRVEVSCITNGAQNAHELDAKPSYLRMLADADAFIQTGLDLEVAWAPELLRSARNPKIMPGTPGFLDASPGIKVLQKPTGAIDRTQGDVHPLGNPHYMLNPNNMKVAARNITAFLKRIDPAGASVYDANYARYWHQIDEADKRWKARLAPFKGSQVVTFHASWPYFASHFGLDVTGTIEPVPGISPSGSYLDKLTETMKAHKVKALLIETWYPTGVPDSLARKTGATVLRLPVYPGGMPGTDTYIATMDYIVDHVAAALK